MNNEEKILAILESMQTDISELKAGQAKLENELDSVKGIVTRIENDHGTKLNALADGYKQNAARLDRIEAKVSAQDEVILRRVFPK